MLLLALLTLALLPRQLMMQKVVMSSIGAGIALAIALYARTDVIRTAAAFASSGLASFAATTVTLNQRTARKLRAIDIAYSLPSLRQTYQQLPDPSSLGIGLKRPIACQGCRHYHGRVYGGHPLICAVHPHGAQSTHCIDWQPEAEIP